MELTVKLPDQFAKMIADQIAVEGAKEVRKQLITLKEACAITGQRRYSLQTAVSTKKLPAYIVGGKPRFKEEDLWAWMEQFKTVK